MGVSQLMTREISFSVRQEIIQRATDGPEVRPKLFWFFCNLDFVQWTRDGFAWAKGVSWIEEYRKCLPRRTLSNLVAQFFYNEHMFRDFHFKYGCHSWRSILSKDVKFRCDFIASGHAKTFPPIEKVHCFQPILYGIRHPWGSIRSKDVKFPFDVTVVEVQVY